LLLRQWLDAGHIGWRVAYPNISATVGSTALGERLDSQSLREIMDRYFGEMRAVIERHGGVVEKYVGDAVMAIFGAPAGA
jgi:class 3 adenylate cyclase